MRVATKAVETVVALGKKEVGVGFDNLGAGLEVDKFGAGFEADKLGAGIDILEGRAEVGKPEDPSFGVESSDFLGDIRHNKDKETEPDC